MTDSNPLIKRYRTLFVCAMVVFVHSFLAPEYSSAADEDRLSEVQATTTVIKRLVEKTPHLAPTSSDSLEKTFPIITKYHVTNFHTEEHLCMHPHILCSLGSLSPPPQNFYLPEFFQFLN